MNPSADNLWHNEPLLQDTNSASCSDVDTSNAARLRIYH